MLIRPEKETDFPIIYDLVKTAFETAKVSNGDEQNFVNRLRAGQDYLPDLALVAEDNGALIGHIMLTKFFVETSSGRREVLLLAPLAVVLDRRKQGIGGRLVEDSFSRARAAGYDAVILVGDPDYYKRFGFQSSATFGIKNKDGIPDQFVMMRELVPGALQDSSGTVTFEGVS